jgi:hypothetical protein
MDGCGDRQTERQTSGRNLGMPDCPSLDRQLCWMMLAQESVEQEGSRPLKSMVMFGQSTSNMVPKPLSPG